MKDLFNPLIIGYGDDLLPYVRQFWIGRTTEAHYHIDFADLIHDGIDDAILNYLEYG